MKISSRSLVRIILVVFTLIQGPSIRSALAQDRPFNPGPDVSTEEGRRILDIWANSPDYGGLSVLVAGEQRFRPVYGPAHLRALFKANSIVALVQGQDATHKAEFANNPATAGFGGRAEDVGEYSGVKGKMGFMNTFSATINGQYGSSGSPIILLDADGNPERVVNSTIVENGFWTLAMDERSAVAQTRNEMLSWIFENNKDSLRLVILFGGASRDAFATFVQSKGGQVGTFFNPEDLKRARVPVFKKVNTGGNGQAVYPLTIDGKDLYAEVLGRPLNYKLPQKKPKGFKADIDVAREKLMKEINVWFPKMAFMTGGIEGSGLVHPAQIGGYDLENQMFVNGEKTVTLKGLKISERYTIGRDILVRDFPHPTRMSMEGAEWAAKEINKPMSVIRWFMENRGFDLNPYTEFLSDFEKGLAYAYGRSDTDIKTYAAGTPDNRRGSTSDAVRAGANVIIDGSREKSTFIKKGSPFDMTEALKASAKELPHRLPPATELWTTFPKGLEFRYVFDSGPPVEFDDLLYSSLNESVLSQYPVTGDFAHYRGFFKGTRGLVLMTPTEYSDIITGRAATGEVGQYLHGVLEQRGFGDRYLVLKNAPFIRFAWDSANWDSVLDQTVAYRKALIEKIVSENALEFIIVDDPRVESELREILSETLGDKNKLKVIRWERNFEVANSGLEALSNSLRFLPKAKKGPYELVRYDIPRSHLFYNSRWWEGTSGERVLTAADPKFRGKVFASVVPDWASKQKYRMPLDQYKKAIELKNWLKQVPNQVTPLEACNFIYLGPAARKENQPWNDPNWNSAKDAS